MYEHVIFNLTFNRDSGKVSAISLKIKGRPSLHAYRRRHRFVRSPFPARDVDRCPTIVK